MTPKIRIYEFIHWLSTPFDKSVVISKVLHIRVIYFVEQRFGFPFRDNWPLFEPLVICIDILMINWLLNNVLFHLVYSHIDELFRLHLLPAIGLSAE